MPIAPYTLEQAEEDIAELRGDATTKEEQLEVTTLIVDGQITATGGTAAAPTLITTDTWQDTGSLENGWGKGTGYFKYKLQPDGTIIVAIKDLTCGSATVADGTEILSAANGLAAGYRPGSNQIRAVYCDQLRVVGSDSEGAAFKFVTDGSVQCLGIAAAATTVDGACILFTDI